MKDNTRTSESTPSEKTPTPKKKVYTSPTVTEFGSVTQFTQSSSTGSGNDGGAQPNNKTVMTMCIGSVSALEEHRLLLRDTTSQNLFREAIHELIQPGDVVLDLGCGTGIHSLFALEAGAKKVYAIESDSVIALAQQVAKTNGYQDKIEFFFGHSDRVTLPEKVDVIITNIGFLPTLAALPSAIKRFLKPGGRTIPSSVALSFVPIHSPEIYTEIVSSWDTPYFDFDFSALRPFAVNKEWSGHFDESNFLSTATSLPEIKYDTYSGDSQHWELEFTMTKSGLMHGLAGWYSFQLTPQITMSTKPPLTLSPKIWSHPFLPFVTPIEVSIGQKLTCTLGFHPKTNPYDPIWTWNIQIDGIYHEHSSFDGTPLSKQLLQKLTPQN